MKSTIKYRYLIVRILGAGKLNLLRENIDFYSNFILSQMQILLGMKNFYSYILL